MSIYFLVPPVLEPFCSLAQAQHLPHFALEQATLKHLQRLRPIQEGLHRVRINILPLDLTRLRQDIRCILERPFMEAGEVCTHQHLSYRKGD